MRNMWLPAGEEHVTLAFAASPRERRKLWEWLGIAQDLNEPDGAGHAERFEPVVTVTAYPADRPRPRIR
jgi:hypothetical protein